MVYNVKYERLPDEHLSVLQDGEKIGESDG